ncbi:fluoride efflux transporter CrcB [Microtetraspora sp. NBRC 16547]|uniref:fluoride efflux transporter CrcB n=1 Tax=Microtetraspora sp. NBRC 16547 TaxID=3030993 RepID=UPI0024A25368|nr:fluoride efflux transporter CrcB [Microtetraspora sp. NBRC 16547]GLX00227.1 putative fluoride ion transporter CrcB 2 [Microtetraspora sp. NBRC 16547]
MTLLLIFLGGAVGAPTRYLIDRMVQRWHDTVFPWGTFAVNVFGSFVLGFLVGAQPGDMIATLAGTGFCGALTTFSTFGFETVRLLEEGSFAEAAMNAVGSLLLGVLAAFGGYGLAVQVL